MILPLTKPLTLVVANYTHATGKTLGPTGMANLATSVQSMPSLMRLYLPCTASEPLLRLSLDPPLTLALFLCPTLQLAWAEMTPLQHWPSHWACVAFWQS